MELYRKYNPNKERKAYKVSSEFEKRGKIFGVGTEVVECGSTKPR